MLDADLAALYEVEVKALNRAVRRNIERFPDDFMFQLTAEEWESLRCQNGTAKNQSSSDSDGLRSQIGTAKGRGGRRTLPNAFTEHGALMLASVLKSDRAVHVSITVVRAFVRLREMLAANADLAKRLDELEMKYDSQFRTVFEAIRQLMSAPPDPPKKAIGFTPGEDTGTKRAKAKKGRA